MKIFFLGGTFDPPHKGHLQIAKKCLKYCDKFILIPAKQAPHKVRKPYFSNRQRLDMLSLLIDDYENIEIDSFELSSEDHISYSVSTIKYLTNKYHNAEISMVIGADLINELSDWKDWATIKNSVKIICINRPKYIIKEKLKYIKYIDDIDVNISSSYIRNLIASKNKQNLLRISDYITNDIFKYIIRTC